MGVLGGEKDFHLDAINQKLERQFGNLNYNKEYFKWAEKETGLSRKEIEDRVSYIMHNIYYVKEPELFTKINGYKFILATNHLSYLSDWLKEINYLNNFNADLNSSKAGCQKPEKEYFEKLIELADVKPEEILFIDDREENVDGAKQVGITALLYNSKKDGLLSDWLLRILDEADTIKEHNKALFDNFRKLNFPKGEYCIVSGGPLAVRGIRKTSDVDVIVSKKLWEQLVKEHPIKRENKKGDIVLKVKLKPEVEILNYPTENSNVYIPKMEEQIAMADEIAGLYFQSLNHCIFFKKAANRVKDQKDLKRIKNYLKSHPEEAAKVTIEF